MKTELSFEAGCFLVNIVDNIIISKMRKQPVDTSAFNDELLAAVKEELEIYMGSRMDYEDSDDLFNEDNA